MTIAEIHGKISSSGSNISDRLEDLLTSDVFGPLRYLPAADGILPVLRKARNYKGEKLSICDGSTCELKLQFWPRFTHSERDAQVEPDVVVEYGKHVVMIEAKYLSGKSGGGEDDFESIGSETASSDQLAKEFHVLKEHYSSYCKHTLIYLTAHNTFPENDINEGCSSNNAEDYKRNTYWLSWFDIHDSIEALHISQQDAHKKLILDDIKCLLYRKGFRKFEGFKKIEAMKVNPVSEKLFYQHAIKRFEGFEKLAIAEINLFPGNIFYQKSD